MARGGTHGEANDAALVICAHGADGGSETAQALARAIGARGRFAAVAACCVHGAPGLAETLAALDAPRVVLVPLLMADGHTARALRRALDEIGDPRLVLAPPLGLSSRLPPLIEALAREGRRARDWAANGTALVLVGHGSRRHTESGIAARGLAGALAARGTFAPVAAAFLQGPPEVDVAIAGLKAPRALAVGLFADQGAHGARDIPERLARFGDRAAYLGPVGALPGIAEVIAAEATAALEKA